MLNAPPTLLSALAASLLTATVQGVVIDFDSVPSGTPVSNQYPGAVFSTQPGYFTHTFVNNGLDNTSPPNVLIISQIGGNIDCHRELYVDFPIPVNNLIFRAGACNQFGIIARVHVFAGNSLLGTENIIGAAADPNTFGFGDFVVNLSSYSAITRIEVVAPLNETLIDGSYGGNGLVYDDFSFDPIPSPATLALFALAPFAATRRRRTEHHAHSKQAPYSLTR